MRAETLISNINEALLKSRNADHQRQIILNNFKPYLRAKLSSLGSDNCYADSTRFCKRFYLDYKIENKSLSRFSLQHTVVDDDSLLFKRLNNTRLLINEDLRKLDFNTLKISNGIDTFSLDLVYVRAPELKFNSSLPKIQFKDIENIKFI